MRDEDKMKALSKLGIGLKNIAENPLAYKEMKEREEREGSGEQIQEEGLISALRALGQQRAYDLVVNRVFPEVLRRNRNRDAATQQGAPGCRRDNPVRSRDEEDTETEDDTTPRNTTPRRSPRRNTSGRRTQGQEETPQRTPEASPVVPTPERSPKRTSPRRTTPQRTSPGRTSPRHGRSPRHGHHSTEVSEKSDGINLLVGWLLIICCADPPCKLQ